MLEKLIYGRPPKHSYKIVLSGTTVCAEYAHRNCLQIMQLHAQAYAHRNSISENWLFVMSYALVCAAKLSPKKHIRQDTQRKAMRLKPSGFMTEQQISSNSTISVIM